SSWLRSDSRRSRRRSAFGGRRTTPQKRSLRLALEGLETRTLLSVLPPPLITSHANISGNTGTAHYSAPSVVVDPTNPQKMVAVFVDHDTSFPVPNAPAEVVQAAYSSDGGSHWVGLYDSRNDVLTDFDSPATNPVPFSTNDEPSAGFDRN